MLGQATTRHLDLTILSPAPGVLALVVAAQQQDDPLSGGVAEDPEKRRIAVSARVEAETKLEQPAAELTSELGVADAEAIPLQQPVDRVAEGPPLWHRHVLSDPAKYGLVTLRRLVELDGEGTLAAHGTSLGPEETTPLG